jgi:hypothetical protein
MRRRRLRAGTGDVTQMPTNQPIKVSLLKESEVAEAGRIVRLAFGTFLGLPNPLDFMGDRDFITARWHSTHVKVIAAREGDRLIGSNVATRWGSFGFFGPLTVLHLCLYQKFGYWPRYLTAIMTRTPGADPTLEGKRADAPALLSAFAKGQREQAIEACGKLTHKIDKGLDLAGEIRAVLAQRTGDVVVTYTRGVLDAFAVCMNGTGSEGGEHTCYVKFGAARGGGGAGERFDKLLDACEAFASTRGATVEAGVNLTREDAYRRMRSHGYRVAMQGVAMQRPNADGFNRADVYVIDDWR